MGEIPPSGAPKRASPNVCCTNNYGVVGLGDSIGIVAHAVDVVQR